MFSISKDFILFLLLSVPFEDQTKSSISNQTLLKLSRVNNDFGLNLFGLLSAENKNDIISPVSLLCAMSTQIFITIHNISKYLTVSKLN